MSAPPRVLITRAEADAEPLALALEALGAEVVRQPAVRVVDHVDAEASAHAQQAWPEVAAIACASRYGARYFAAWLERYRLIIKQDVTLFAVGPATAMAMRTHLQAQAIVASPHTAVGLAQAILAHVSCGATILLPTARDAGGPLARALQEHLCQGVRLPLYATELVLAQAPMTAASVVDYIVFTSPSCVRGYMASGHNPGAARVVTLGPSTSAAARAAGLMPFAQAQPASLVGLIDVFKECLCSTPPCPPRPRIQP